MNGTGIAVSRVMELISVPHALGLTMHGAPRHPLYVKADTWPTPFAHCPAVAAYHRAAQEPKP